VSLRRLLLPDPPRRVPGKRALGLALRAAHLTTFGVLVGGHVLSAEPDRILPFLQATVASGVALMTLEMASTCEWLVMGKGLAVLLKLALLLLVPVFWEARAPILLLTVVVASVGAHMPSRFRHYSFRTRRVVNGPPRPVSR